MSAVTTEPVTRVWDGLEIPAAGTYTFDVSHSHVGFSVRHLMVAKVRGSFGSFSGSLTVGEDPADSSIEVTIDIDSVDTRDPQRDGHLRSEDFFDSANHPTMTYRSTAVRHDRRDRWHVDGELTVRGVTRPVALDVVLEGLATDPWGGSRAVFSATTAVNREDFGLTWNQALETGGVLVGKDARIEIEVEAVRQAGPVA